MPTVRQEYAKPCWCWSEAFCSKREIEYGLKFSVLSE